MGVIKYKQPEVGDIIGSWTVLAVDSSPNCLCRCVCGSEKMVKRASLSTGVSTRCRGCASKDAGKGNRKFFYPNGATKRLIWQVRGAIQRCTNPNHPRWEDWGGRGVKVCQEWLDDQTKFVEYLMTLEGWNDTSLLIDRIDNNGHYEPGNLRFVTASESQFNKRPYKSRCK